MNQPLDATKSLAVFLKSSHRFLTGQKNALVEVWREIFAIGNIVHNTTGKVRHSMGYGCGKWESGDICCWQTEGSRLGFPCFEESRKGAGFISVRVMNPSHYPSVLWDEPAPILIESVIPFPTKALYIPSATYPLSAPYCVPAPTPSRDPDWRDPAPNSIASFAYSFAVAAGLCSESAL